MFENAFKFLCQSVAAVVEDIETCLLHADYLCLQVLWRESGVEIKHGILGRVALCEQKHERETSLHRADRRYDTFSRYV